MQSLNSFRCAMIKNSLGMEKPSKTSISCIFVRMDVEKSYNEMHGFSSTSPFSIRAFDLHNGSRKVSSRGSTVPDLHRSAWSQPGWYLMTAADCGDAMMCQNHGPVFLASNFHSFPFNSKTDFFFHSRTSC